MYCGRHSPDCRLISRGKQVVLEHRLSSGTACVLKCGFTNASEDKLRGCIMPDLKHGPSICKTYALKFKGRI